MFVEWDPEDGADKQTWNFDSGDVKRKDATAIEKQYGGGGWDSWLQGLMTGQIEARAVLLWHMLRQVHPTLKFDDIPDFRVRQLTVHMGVQELKDLWKRVKRVRLSPEDREQFEDAFVGDMEEALLREGREPDFDIVNGEIRFKTADLELPKPV